MLLGAGATGGVILFPLRMQHARARPTQPGMSRRRRGGLSPPLLLMFFLSTAVRQASARMLAPMRRESALGLVRRLAAGSQDLLSIDIGGTLAKVVLFQPHPEPPPEGQAPALDLGDECTDVFGPDQLELSIYAPDLGGNLHFFVFETRFVSDVIRFVGQHWPRVSGGLKMQPIEIRATGGGAYKHAADLRSAGIALDLEDEMSAMVAGLSFLLNRIQGELFAVDMDSVGQFTPLATPAACAQLARNYVNVQQPPSSYLYVSIGSGVSILEVHSDGTADGVSRYRRVGGSSVGGSTFWGLVRLLTSCSTFDGEETGPSAPC